MEMEESVAVVRRLVDRINCRDLAGLVELMTDDHEFIDATGAVHAGRERMREGWKEYFSSFPDYRIDIEEAIGEGRVVAIFGWASGTFKNGAPKASSWRVPASWKGIVRDGRVFQWRVYCDVEPMLRSMGINRF
jgi:ketosteroid isomerase-like protein